MCELFWYYSQAEETEEKKKGTEGGDAETKMEVDEEKPTPVAATPAPADQDSSNSQAQKSESASDGQEDTAPVTENAESTEVRNNVHLLCDCSLSVVMMASRKRDSLSCG